jgi:hypothetical protein
MNGELHAVHLHGEREEIFVYEELMTKILYIGYSLALIIGLH